MTTQEDSPQRVSQEQYLKRLILAIGLTYPNGLILSPESLSIEAQSKCTNFGLDMLQLPSGHAVLTLMQNDPRAKNGTEEPSLIIR